MRLLFFVGALLTATTSRASVDLTVSALAVTVESTKITYKLTLCNFGTTDLSSTIWVGLYYDLPAAPSCGSGSPSQNFQIKILKAGSCLLPFERTQTFMLPPTGTYTAWGFIDRFCAVSETNELNNTRGTQYTVGNPDAGPPDAGPPDAGPPDGPIVDLLAADMVPTDGAKPTTDQGAVDLSASHGDLETITPPTDPGGCGCQTPAAPSGKGTLLLFGLLLFRLRSRRRSS